MAKIYVGVGHGGTDCGACGNGLKEKDLNLSIAKHCVDELKKYDLNVKISRTKDVTHGLNDKIKDCNEFNPDFALDIHNNAGGGNGAEVLHTINGGKGKKFAQEILNAICKETGQDSRGLKTKTNSDGRDYFGFIRSVKAPSVIVECAFIDNKKDVQIIDTEKERKKMGKAIAHGILNELGIKIKKEEKKKKEKYKGKFPKLPKKKYLEKGDEGEQVIYLQDFLNWYSDYKLYVDGKFGAKTKKAVEDFQRNEDLKIDGVFGKSSLAVAKKVKK